MGGRNCSAAGEQTAPMPGKLLVWDTLSANFSDPCLYIYSQNFGFLFESFYSAFSFQMFHKSLRFSLSLG